MAPLLRTLPWVLFALFSVVWTATLSPHHRTPHGRLHYDAKRSETVSSNSLASVNPTSLNSTSTGSSIIPTASFTSSSNSTANYTLSSDGPPLLANSTAAQVQAARALIEQAQEQMAASNLARLANPQRNIYSLQENSTSTPSKFKRQSTTPLFNATDEIRAAAALVAEADAWAQSGNGTSLNITKRAATIFPGAFWLGNIPHIGGWPFGFNSGDYKVFRDVTTYGAKGDGVTDDTQAIQNAVADFMACGTGCYGSTTKGAIIYFPPGTYLISSTIETHYGTQFIGDAISRPILKAAASFVGLGVISTDKYVGGGNGVDGNAKEWFINTANFYRQIRNFVIDITATPDNAGICGLHYQVAQATSLSFVEFRASTSASTTQVAVFAENGSGGFMSDLIFNGGAYGIFGGSQQFTSQRLTFNNVQTAVQLIWDWGWVWKTININGCGTGFKLVGNGTTVSNTGSALIVDSIFQNTGTAILTDPASLTAGQGSTGVTLDNVVFNSVTNGVIDVNGKVYLPGSTPPIDTWIMGRTYFTPDNPLATVGNSYTTSRIEALTTGTNPWGLPKNPFFERAKPQYENYGSSQFISMGKACPGDGKTDVTNCFQNILNQWANTNTIIYIDAGSYILTNTINVPANIKIVGEVWAQLVAKGNTFGDPLHPVPLLRVGQPGQQGNVEMQDLLFTSIGYTPGLIMVEWNVRAETPGSVGMWDCHSRSGGAVGTELLSTNCLNSNTGDQTSCKAGSMLVHVTKQSSIYLENTWFWVADHDTDDANWSNDDNAMPFTSVYVARGVLIESITPSWYYGTAAEHSVFYQFNLQGAANQYMAMIQTEQAYYQPTPAAPYPFPLADGLYPGDPKFVSGGDGHGWALIIQNSTDIQISGAGLYSWFQDYTQTCVDSMNCQQTMVHLSTNQQNVRIHNLVTIGAANMINSDGTMISAKDNLAVNFHPYWSQIAVFDPIQTAASLTCSNSPPQPANSTIPSKYGMIALEAGGNPGIVQFTLFNGSPYWWRLGGGSHSYQIYTTGGTPPPGVRGNQIPWQTAFTDIAPGTGLTVYTIFANAGNGYTVSEVDDKAEIYYTVDGTGETFEINAHVEESYHPKWRIDVVFTNLATNDVANGTRLQLEMPQDGTAGLGVQWGLVGSKEYGYWTVNPGITWMHNSLGVIGDRQLKYICMPGTHDSGMSEINGKTIGVGADNTKTQILDIYGQLIRGARWLDIRPCIGNGGQQLLCHYTHTDDHLNTGFGANGITLLDMIWDVNLFMDQYPGELVILDIGDEAGFDTDEGTYPKLNVSQWQAIIDTMSEQLGSWACPQVQTELGVPLLSDVTLNDLIGNGRGCVIMSFRNMWNYPGVNLDSNQFSYNTAFKEFNSYSDSTSVSVMGQDQMSKLAANRLLDGTGAKENFFVLSWTLTAGVIGETEQDLAADAIPWLYSYAYSGFTPWSYPNVMMIDYLGEPNELSLSNNRTVSLAQTTNDIIILALAVNLLIASQNCHVGGLGLVSRSVEEGCTLPLNRTIGY